MRYDTDKEAKEDLERKLFDDWYNFRVVESEGKLYIQREYMVTGYEPDGTYNPCIDTEWNTLTQVVKGYQMPDKYRGFETPQELLRFWKTSSTAESLFSNVYGNVKQFGELPNYKVVGTRDSLMEQYPEAIL